MQSQVLVIEPEGRILLSWQALLRASGYAVAGFTTIEAALAAASATGAVCLVVSAEGLRDSQVDAWRQLAARCPWASLILEGEWDESLPPPLAAHPHSTWLAAPPLPRELLPAIERALAASAAARAGQRGPAD